VQFAGGCHPIRQPGSQRAHLCLRFLADHHSHHTIGPKAALDRLRERGAKVHVSGQQEIDFARALLWLRKQWKIKRLLCEGGGELNQALFRAGLVDELHLTICRESLAGAWLRQSPMVWVSPRFRGLASSGCALSSEPAASCSRFFARFLAQLDISRRLSTVSCLWISR